MARTDLSAALSEPGRGVPHRVAQRVLRAQAAPGALFGLVDLVAILGLFAFILPPARPPAPPATSPLIGESAEVGVEDRDEAGVPGPAVAFHRVHVIHMTGNGDPVWRDRTVLVRDGRIEQIGKADEVRVPEDAIRIDGLGRLYMTPGLTDAHVHLDYGAENWLPLFLANGVTTVFNLRGDPRHLEMRERIESGELLGPTIYTSGVFVNLPRIETAEDAEQEVRNQAAAGYDFLKIHGELEPEAFSRLTEVARETGIAVIGHAPRNLPFDAVLETRMPMVAHAEELIYTHFKALNERRIDELAVRMANSGTWLTPTLSTFHNIADLWGDSTAIEPALRRPEAGYLPELMRSYWTDRNPYAKRSPEAHSLIRNMYAFQIPLVAGLHERGVPLLTGTDAPLPGIYPGWSLHDEIDELVGAGLPVADALAAATRNPGAFIAAYVDADEEFGTIEVGARADLVLVDGNPLEDPSALRRPLGVMTRGEYLDRHALQTELDRVAAENR